jgi:ABC-type lipoprotein release transport system permease subunit
MDFGILMPTLFRGAWNFDMMIAAPLVGILVSVLVAYFPAKKALKMGITDCLRHQ